MSGEMKWFRLYSEIIHDPKVRRLKDAAKFGVLVGLLALASECKIRGWVCIEEDMPYELDELAEILMATPEKISETISDLQKLRIIQVDDDGIIKFPNWDKRQYDKPSDRPDAVRERVKRHREKKKNVSPAECNADVTPLKRECNAIDTDTELDKDIDLDNKSYVSNNTSLLSIEGGYGGKQPSGDVVEIAEHIDVLNLFEHEFGRTLSHVEKQSIIELAKKYDHEIIKKAVTEAVIKQKLTISYVRGILKDWEIHNLKTMDEIEKYEMEFAKNKALKKGGQAYGNGPPGSDPAEDILNTPSRYRHLAR